MRGLYSTSVTKAICIDDSIGLRQFAFRVIALKHASNTYPDLRSDTIVVFYLLMLKTFLRRLY